MASYHEEPESKGINVQLNEEKMISTKSIEDREKAMRFLNSPSIADLSKEMKGNYLKLKGFSSQDIESLYDEMNNKKFDIIWNSEGYSKSIVKEDTTAQQYHPQHRYYPHPPLSPTYDQSNDKEMSLPNPVVPMTIGGMIAVFGLAAFRWLNGQDFILFPTIIDRTIADTMNEEVDDYQSETNNTIDACDGDKGQEEPLARDIQNLTATIENLAQIQKDTIKILERDKATKVTNVAMTALRKQSNTNNINHDIIDKIVECKSTFDALLKECKSWNIQSQPEVSESPSHDIISFISPKLESIGLMLEYIQNNIKEEIQTLKFDSKIDYPTICETKEQDVLSTPKSIERNDPRLPNKKMESSPDKGNESNTCQSIENVTSTIQSEFPTIIPSMESFQEALRMLQKSNSPPLIRSGCQMLYLHISNLIAHPSDKQFKRISTKSSTFKSKIGNVECATQVLKSVGFKEEGSYLVYKSESERTKLQEKDTSNHQNVQKSSHHQITLESKDLELLRDAASCLKQLL
jgi:hypothetical protein